MTEAEKVEPILGTTDGETLVEITSPYEEAAREQNWVPKDEWVESGKDEAEWRPAKEFVERGELFKSIHTTKRELKQTQAALTALQRHHQHVFEKAHQAAVRDLKLEKRAAIRNEDLERAEELEDELDELQQSHATERSQLQQAQAAAAAAGPDPRFVSWVSGNAWYETDADLRDYADTVGMMYVNKNPDVRSNPELVLQHVAKEVRKRYPEKFGIVGKRSAPNPVASGDRTQKPTRQSSGPALTDLETEIMTTLVKQGVMTEEQYRAELKKVG